MDESFYFRLPNDLGQVPVLRARFVRSCEKAGLLVDEIQESMLVFTELVNNSIEHGCSRPEDFVDGHYRITDTEIELLVTDPGEVLTAEHFNSRGSAEDFAETGRGAGLFLIQALTDQVHVEPGPCGGTTIRIVKRRKRGSAA